MTTTTPPRVEVDEPEFRGVSHQQHATREEIRGRKERHERRLCAFRFLTEADHDEVCTLSPTCSRTYGPGAHPDDLGMYEGTGIGAIYGLEMRADHAADLAGWTVVGLNDVWPDEPTTTAAAKADHTEPLAGEDDQEAEAPPAAEPEDEPCGPAPGEWDAVE